MSIISFALKAQRLLKIRIFEVVGVLEQHLIIRKGFPAPFFYTGSPSFMQESLSFVKETLEETASLFKDMGFQFLSFLLSLIFGKRSRADSCQRLDVGVT